MSFPWFPRHNRQTRRARVVLPRRRRDLYFMVALALLGGRAWAAGPLPSAIPIPCSTCKSPQGTTLSFVQSGLANWSSSTATLTQQSPTALLNWASFNIGSNATVTFNQPSARAIAVNRIWDGNPSQIYGGLRANGQVYLLNQNGIIFGPTAQVNVGSLVASALDITPAALSTDIGSAINSNASPAFQPFTDSAGNPIVNGSITILSGANLQGQQIFLFAPNVTNAGHIETTNGGQAILAAGTTIYLIESNNTGFPSGASDFQSGDFNGYVVEVTVNNVTNAELQSYLTSQLITQPGGAVTQNPNATPLPSGTVTNSAPGEIIANHGNVSLIGLAVNQDGRVTATTSVRSNGSIRLVAQDESISETALNNQLIMGGTRTGAVYLGPNSVTEVRPDLSDSTTDVAVDPQPLSNVRLDGQTIFLDQGAQVTATSGNVYLTAYDAQVSTSVVSPPPSADDSWVYLASGSGIDVSGDSLTLPMSSNLLTVQLRQPELQNSPLQTSLLYGQTITVDLRQHGTNADGTPWVGTPLVDLSGDVAGIESTVAQRSTTGGTVSIDTNGSAVIRAGANINLSGGVVHYDAGNVNTTQLISQGTVYDIAKASPDVLYSGIANTFKVNYAKWGVTRSWNILGGSGSFQNAYNVGMDAGALTLKAPQLVLDGNVYANNVVGPYQRNSPSALQPGQQRWQDEVPLGGQIIIGDASPTTPDYRAPNVLFSPDPLLSSQSFNPATNKLTDVLPDYAAVNLTPDLLPSGISRVAVYSNGSIDLPADVPLNLSAGGTLSLTGAGGIDLEGPVHVPAGSVSLTVKPFATTGEKPAALIIGKDASIDVSGGWVNDSLATSASPAPALINGGTVSLDNTYGDIDLMSGSVIDVSGGAWLQANGKIKNGNGGSITLAVQPIIGSTTITPTALDLGGTLRGYASGTGGTLNITANGICIGLSCAAGAPGQLNLDPEFFSQGGFANYKLTSNLDNLEILGDATIMPRVESLTLDPGAATQPTGSHLVSFSQPTVLPDAQRAPVNLEFDVAPSTGGITIDSSNFNQLGVLTMDAGASILADPGANVSFNSSTRLYVDGTVDAPAGKLAFVLTSGLSQQAGYIPSQSLWFGPHAQLIATGTVRRQPNALGLREGEVLPGGTISIDAQRGYIVAQSGATLNVSGTAAPIDLTLPGGVVQPTTIASDAGAVNLTAAEGIFFDGTLQGQAGGPGAAGGSFSLTLDPQLIGASPPASDVFPTNARVITLNDGTGPSVPSWLVPGGDFVDPATGQTLSGQAQVNGAALIQGGFDAVTLVSRDLDPTIRSSVGSVVPGEIQLQGRTGTLALTLGRRLTLDAASLALDPNTSSAMLGAPYILLGNSGTTSGPNLQTTPAASTPPPSSGSGKLEFDAQLIDVQGNSVTQNISQVTLDSQGDIRLFGLLQSPQGRTLTGSFTTAGDMILQAAQVYPATLSSFTLESTGVQGTIQFTSQGQPTPVLEAGGQLIVQAANIYQDGVVKAPLGEIDLNALSTLDLGQNSITSTSANGQLIPFGQLQGGFAWVYYLSDGETLAFGNTDPLPQKRVALSAPTVNVEPGANIDVSGGGDFFAYQFNPGVLSSTDLLANKVTPNTFAILPGLNSLYAPYDPEAYAGSTLQPGDSVYLSGGIPGLKPGQYALLPASYALLPGAYLVTAVSGYQGLLPGQLVSQTNGVPVVSGYRTVAGTGIRDALTSGFAVQLGSSILTQASYGTEVASQFFTNLAATNGTAVPRLPQDAGVVAITAQQALTLDGNLLAATTGRGAAVDISAAQIEVVPQAGAGQAVPGVLQLGADQLNAFGAESLLLGATRTDTSAGTELSVGATLVTVDGGVSLQVPELMLAASDTVNVNGGSQLTATGTLSGTPGNILIGDSVNTGNGALLRLSAGSQTELVRQNYDQTSGTLNIQAGATLKADGSMMLDATKDLSFSPSANLIDHGALTVGAGRVSLGDVTGNPGGFVLSSAAIANLGVTDLALRSYTSLNLFGNVSLNLNSLSLETGEIAAGSSNTQATLTTSGDLSWSNPNSPPSGTSTTGSGSLVLHGARVLLGDGSYVASGFSNNVTIWADNSIIAQGTAGTLGVAGNLTLSAPRITGAAKADVAITAGDGSGNYFPISINLGQTSPASLPNPDLGASLTLTGSSISQGGNIDLPSGSLTLAAKGPATTDGVVLASGSQTWVGGSTKSYGGTNVYAPGGHLTLSSDNGNVNVQPNTVPGNVQINVAGGPDGGDGGTLTVSAPNGTLNLDPNATLAGGTLSGYTGAAVALDVATLDFSSFNGALNQAGFNSGIGFTGARTLRQRTGDITIGPNDTVTAQTITLSADAGGISVSGTLDASGAQGGGVTLNAQNDISLQGARINASATGAGQDGGRVALNTGTGEILMDASSTINVAGGGTDPTTGVTGAGGQVALRLPQASVLSVLGGSGSPELTQAGIINGSAQTTIEGFKVYDYSAAGQIVAADTAVGSPLYVDASNFVTQASSALTALGTTVGNVQVVPGIEIDSKNDLALNSTWDFLNWRFNGAAGVLTLRAAGNLNINNTITDNFNTQNVLQTGPSSWSYRLVAGADLDGASPLALLPAGQGNFTLAAGTPSDTSPVQTAIRTGAADIAIAAAGNIVLGNSASVIYTAGNASASSTNVNPVTGVTTTTTLITPKALGSNHPYPQGKSDITLDALGNIGYSDGAIIPNQLFTGWLYRAGRPSTSTGPGPGATGWTVAFEHFQQGIGALAGGNVDVQAGGDINDLSVSIPTIGIPETVTTTTQVGTNAPTSTKINQLVILGGGNLRVTAGGDIASGIFYTGQGDMNVRAGGSLTSDHTASSTYPQPVYTILGLGGGQAEVTARGDLALETVVNPTLVAQDAAELVSSLYTSVFSTYAPSSAVRLTAVGGNLMLDNNASTLQIYMTEHNSQGSYNPYTNASDAVPLLTVYPPLLQASALSGNIDIQGSMTLYPAPKGNLELLANDSVTLAVGTQVVLSDADPNLLPSPSDPTTTYTNTSNALTSALTATNSGFQHASVPVHADQNQLDGQPDTTPVQVVALTGDVTVEDPNANTFFDLAKPAVISAGRDVVDLWLVAQNLNTSDETLVTAGRDIVYTNLRDNTGSVGTNRAQIVVDGPGQLIVQAGRNVDLAASNGISTRGNSYNPALPSGGADVTVLTGAAGPVDYADFIQKYFVTGQNYSDELTAYMQTLTGGAALTPAAALTAFLNLPQAQQQPMVLSAFYQELRASGEVESNSGNTSDYNRGFTAIQTLFPKLASAPADYAGDLTLYFSKIFTYAGGDINLVVPGGAINAGLSTPPVSFGLADQQIGIEAQGTGSVNSFSYGNFEVNASRVFAVDGGNIMLWSSTGNIDAGRGAKTALSAPPPTVTFSHGEATPIFPPALQGSGIREFVTTPGTAPGVVDLFAPAGAVNAGDAGIGSAGNLNIAAQQVIGADNIQVSGVSTGVPVANVGGLSAGLSGAGSVAAAASNIGTDVTQNLGDQSNKGFLGVEVMGFGDESPTASCTPGSPGCSN